MGHVSVQVFLNEETPSDRIAIVLRSALRETNVAAVRKARFGSVSRLAKSINVKAPTEVVELIRGLSPVVDVLDENQEDAMIQPVGETEVDDLALIHGGG